MSALGRVKVVCHRAGQGFMAWFQQVAVNLHRCRGLNLGVGLTGS